MEDGGIYGAEAGATSEDARNTSYIHGCVDLAALRTHDSVESADRKRKETAIASVTVEAAQPPPVVIGLFALVPGEV